MSREIKCRRICFQHFNRTFTPNTKINDSVKLSIEECEAIRLADHENIDQEQAAARMAISRGTFQRILYSARYKISDALIYGKGIIIGGGNYILAETCCNCRSKCKECRFANSKNNDTDCEGDY